MTVRRHKSTLRTQCWRSGSQRRRRSVAPPSSASSSVSVYPIWGWVGSYPKALQAAKQWFRLGGDVRHRHQAMLVVCDQVALIWMFARSVKGAKLTARHYKYTPRTQCWRSGWRRRRRSVVPQSSAQSSPHSTPAPTVRPDRWICTAGILNTVYTHSRIGGHRPASSSPYKVTLLIRNRSPPYDHHMALGIGLL